MNAMIRIGPDTYVCSSLHPNTFRWDSLQETDNVLGSYGVMRQVQGRQSTWQIIQKILLPGQKNMHVMAKIKNGESLYPDK